MRVRASITLLINPISSGVFNLPRNRPSMHARESYLVIHYSLFRPLPLPDSRFGLHGFGFLPPLLPAFIPTPFPLPSLGLFSPLGFESADMKSH